MKPYVLIDCARGAQRKVMDLTERGAIDALLRYHGNGGRTAAGTAAAMARFAELNERGVVRMKTTYYIRKVTP